MMPTRIDRLTPAQKAAIPAFREKWIAIGLRTGDTDWATFERAMPICYAKAGLPYPSRVVRVDSPLVGAFAAGIAASVWKQRCDQKNSVSVRESACVAVRVAVGGAVGEAVREAVGGAVDGAVRVAVDEAVLWEGARSISRLYGVQLSEMKWHGWLGGQFLVGGAWYWGVAYVQFFFEVCGLTLTQEIHERATAYRQVCESVNYVWPNRRFVMVCARPAAIHRDAEGRLHQEHGMSIRYPDGWGLYHLHGVRFLPELYHQIVSRSMSAKQIMQLEDIDQRVQAMKFSVDGYREWFQAEGGVKRHEYDKVDLVGRRIHYELWRIPKGQTFTRDVQFALYECPSSVSRGTRKEYAKGVPLECETVPQALAWGMSSDEVTVTPDSWELMKPLIHEA